MDPLRQNVFTITYWGVTGTLSAPLRPAEVSDKLVAAIRRLAERDNLGILFNLAGVREWSWKVSLTTASSRVNDFLSLFLTRRGLSRDFLSLGLPGILRRNSASNLTNGYLSSKIGILPS